MAMVMMHDGGAAAAVVVVHDDARFFDGVLRRRDQAGIHREWGGLSGIEG
jgi:hypothetical protein